MSNREKGEVTVEIDGTSYTFCLDMPAMIACEDHFSKEMGRDVYWGEIFDKVLKSSMRHVRVYIWASFLKYHPQMTLDQATDLVQAFGGIVKFSTHIGALGNATTPDVADLKAMGIDAKANPRKAQARRKGGTGLASTSRPAASA